MELLLLGTAAAEGWPSPFCECAACAKARALGGRDIRTRAGALLDDVVKVDFGPDTFMQMQRQGRSLLGMTTLVFTHAHDDHFIPVELQYRKETFSRQKAMPLLHLYGNEEVCERLRSALGAPAESRIMLHPPLEPFCPVTSPDGTEILPLPATHGPGALILRLTRSGKSLLYGHDSGVFPEESIQALAGHPLEAALFDCTYGLNPATGWRGHMGLAGVLEMTARLRENGAVTSETQLIATHFSHQGGAPYDALVTAFLPHGIRVAYDGLRTQF